MNIICFHNPEEENGYLSNWYLRSFVVEEIEYSSMEQYMMVQKAICFKDTSIAKQILATEDVAIIKALGRQVSNYNESIWNGIRQIIVYKGLIAKFSQNQDLKEKLLATDPAILTECAVKDCVWGIGLSMKDENRFDLLKWKGQNLLGYTLMQVRKKLSLEL